MSAGLTISLLVVGLALCLLVIKVETELTRKRKGASPRLECERRAREATKPYGNCDYMGPTKRLPL